jgi:quercetin dioxygenase-like cupin family protein
MFGHASGKGRVALRDGIMVKTINSGASMTMAEFTMEKGAELPEHRHVHEQAGYVVRGSISLSIGGQTREMGLGDSWDIPSDVPHSARALEDSVVVEVFSPRREEFEAYRRAEDCEA